MVDDLLKIPGSYIVDLPLNIERDFPDSSLLELAGVQSVLWYASINPQVAGVSAVVSSRERFEEINLFVVKLKSLEGYYPVLINLGKRIKYHCLIVLQFNSKYKILLSKYLPNKLNHDENSYLRFNISRWIHVDCHSAASITFLKRISTTLKSEGSIKELINRLDDDIDSFRQKGLSRAHVDRLIKLMLGKVSQTERDYLLRHCDVTEFYPKIDKYGKNRSSTYILVHDYEDVWYCFMQYEPIKAIIDRRQYGDLEELMYYVESQYASEDGY